MQPARSANPSRGGRQNKPRGGNGWRGGAVAIAVAACLALVPAPLTDAPSAANARTITAAEWESYRARYVSRDGRVIDREKGMVSHSEGQGYGMLLAVAAGDQATFDRIWRFVGERMRGRSDQLVSWLWDPTQSPQIADSNNASDGDILIAYALLKAAIAWGDRKYLRAADTMIGDIGRILVRRQGDRVVLRPAAFGFEEGQHAGGPVVNLSYYIYGAFPLFAIVRPEFPWIELVRDGLALKEEARRNPLGLAPDWITIREGHAHGPAQGHAPHSSYDAVRIPLYMLMEGDVPRHFLEPYDARWNRAAGGTPLAYDLSQRRVMHTMGDPGYRMIAALVGCALRNAPIPADLRRFRTTTYFASTLHLLSLSTARAHYPQCLDPTGATVTTAGLRYELVPPPLRR